MFLLELQQRPNADADRKYADDEPLNGAEGEADTARLRRKPAGLPAASTAALTCLARTGESAMLHCAFQCGPAIKSQSTRTSDGVGSSAQEAESCAPCDEEGDNRRDC